MFIEQQGEAGDDHPDGFAISFGSSVESDKIVPDDRILSFY